MNAQSSFPPQVDVEPITGVVWRQQWRYQHNVAVQPPDFQLPRQQPIRMSGNISERPLPVFWVESSFVYTAEGVGDFQYRVRIRHKENPTCVTID